MPLNLQEYMLIKSNQTFMYSYIHVNHVRQIRKISKRHSFPPTAGLLFCVHGHFGAKVKFTLVTFGVALMVPFLLTKVIFGAGIIDVKILLQVISKIYTSFMYL